MHFSTDVGEEQVFLSGSKSGGISALRLKSKSSPGVAMIERMMTPAPPEDHQPRSEAELPKPPEVGDRLGPYELVELLAVGGMATIFRARHTTLGREDAVKILLPEYCDKPGVVHRFFKEAHAVNLIDHPNIIAITDFVEGTDQPPYMVMELLEGRTLLRYIRDHAPLAPGTVITIASQVCDAMETVHGHGIVHRDLKPDNIFIREEPSGALKVKLLDFGIAKFLADEDRYLKTLSGSAVGTPEYMAPEQIIGEDVDQRIDLYAMGVILYELITGRQPFTATVVGELVTAHLSEIPKPPSAWLTGPEAAAVPAVLDEAVLRCLIKSPAQRIQTMRELRELLESTPVEDAPRAAVDIKPLDYRVKTARPWLALGSGLAALVALAGLSLYLWTGRSSDGETSSDPGMRAAATRTDTSAPRKPARDARAVRLTSKPSGALLFRNSDGQFLGRTPMFVQVRPGQPLTLRLRLDGYRESRMTVRYSSKSPIDVTLAALPTSDPGMQVASGMTPPGMKGMHPQHHPQMRPAMTPMAMDPMLDPGGTFDPFKK
ncbi:MAG: serine/threonine-protein kinase [bacterium]